MISISNVVRTTYHNVVNKQTLAVSAGALL